MLSRRVAMLLLDGVVLHDVGSALQAFGPRVDRPGRPDQVYELEVCGVRPGLVPTTSGIALEAPHGLDALQRADLVVVPGVFVDGVHEQHEAFAAVRAAHARGARVLSICTGAFVLAHAGVLDGRPATTHWGYCQELADRFPGVEVRPDVLFVDDGDVLTSAGLSAGMDLCLHLLRRELGADYANGVARWNVVAPHREGGQAQFIDRPFPVTPGGLAATRSWALERLEQPLSVRELAQHAHVSERTFTRRFRAETGVSPKQWLLAQRVQHARHLLESTALSVEEIATASGFGSPASLRVHFQRATATRPTAYRTTFRSTS